MRRAKKNRDSLPRNSGPKSQPCCPVGLVFGDNVRAQENRRLPCLGKEAGCPLSFSARSPEGLPGEQPAWAGLLEAASQLRLRESLGGAFFHTASVYNLFLASRPALAIVTKMDWLKREKGRIVFFVAVLG